MKRIVLVMLALCLLVLPASASSHTYTDSFYCREASSEGYSDSSYSYGSTVHHLVGDCNISYTVTTSKYIGTPDNAYGSAGLYNIETGGKYFFVTRQNVYNTYYGTSTISNLPEGDYKLVLYVYAYEYSDDSRGMQITIQNGTVVTDSAVEEEEAKYIDWDQSTYSSGDIALINYTYPTYVESNENFIDVRSYNPTSSVWELEERQFVYSESGSVQYSVPSYSSRQFRAELMTRAGVLYSATEIANDTMQMTSSGAALEFTKYIYDRDENMTFSYYNMPEGATIQFYSGTTPTGATYFQQYSVEGNGTAGYQLPSNGPYGELFYIRAYDSSSNELGYDYAYTEDAPTGEATLHGRVRDAETEGVISGATITVAGQTTTTDSSGDYSLTIPKGTWDITVSASNYVTKTVSDFTFSGSSYTYYPYLQPSPAASTTLYGTVSSSTSGAAITGATVTVSDGSTTKSDVTAKGYFEISGLTDGDTYTIKVQQTYFESYQATFTFDSSDNIYTVLLVPKADDEEADEETEEGESGGLSDEEDEDDSSSSSDDDYRPGRAAARSTLENAEETVPNLIPTLILVVFVAAVKKGLK
ncbi:carboxypeptidase-like regulatory domain-containing protein [Methanolobus profundi]|uniref:Carboxypeptidase regulatory-like domain-containing protein n=1 Tax=Methanolobus profundi TaxID=487685 RepID=A0A1I4UMM1_9EURY|nr:carboxypeptidase-like regulatory domain-containing protein [Methanolobus profundi]SFM90247.1 Carboxypeptidase regulatory-like domain-containing protein [Methanolobus profundi]